MKAWTLKAPGSIELADSESRFVDKDYVKIKLRYSSISAPDLLMYDGRLSFNAPLILGRQGIGMVTEVGDSEAREESKNIKLKRGDMVAIKPFSACGGCMMCTGGKPNECENKLVYGINTDGFLSDFTVVKAEDVYKLPERIDLKSAILLEHIDIAISTINELKLERGEHIVINGASYLGLIIAQLALSSQAVPIIVDYDKERLALAQKYVYYVLDYSEVDVRKKILNITGGRMSETIVHMPQSGLPFGQALSLAGNNGRVAIAGWENTADMNGINVAPILNRQLVVKGINGSCNNFPAAINMLVNHTVDVEFDKLPVVGFNEVASIFSAHGDYNQKFIYSKVIMD